MAMLNNQMVVGKSFSNNRWKDLSPPTLGIANRFRRNSAIITARYVWEQMSSATPCGARCRGRAPRSPIAANFE
jgi:hypothetical protein